MKNLSNKTSTYLEKGKSYRFTVKKIDLALTNSYILKDEFGVSHLLPLNEFSKYAFTPDQVIFCNVVKINCSGKIFLEPHHPYYKVDSTYTFSVLSSSPIKLLDGRDAKLLKIKDKLGNIIPIPARDIPSNGKIRLKVVNIYKGVPYLINEDIAIEQFFRIRHSYPMFIKHISQQKDQIQLKDRFENVFHLPFLTYKHFKLQEGDRILCTVLYHKYPEVRLEPRNPSYEIGKHYTFKYGGILKEHHPSKSSSIVHFAIDCYGKKAMINYKNDSRKEFPKIGEDIQCEIIRLKKGTLVLSY